MDNVSYERDGLMLKPYHSAGTDARSTLSLPRAYAGAAELEASRAVLTLRARIAVVDDDPAVLRSLGRLLFVHGFEARTFSSPTALLADIEALAPACVIADLSMPELTGLELQQRLEDSGATYPMVFITAHGDIRASVLAMRSGAIDFLTKPFDQADLLDAVSRALAKTEHTREEAERRAGIRCRLDSLTHRERDVYHHVVAGLLNKQIAAKLGISEKTVKVHRARVMRKMGVRSIAQLARIAEQIEDAEPRSEK